MFSKIQIYHKYIRGGPDLPGKGQKCYSQRQNQRKRECAIRTAQREFEKQHSHKEFMEIFGRNYLDPVEIGENNEKKDVSVQDRRPERETGL